jgi:hypothetical protein
MSRPRAARVGSVAWPILAVVFALPPLALWIVVIAGRAGYGDAGFLNLFAFFAGIFWITAVASGVVALAFGIVGLARRSPLVLGATAMLLAVASLALTLVYGWQAATS